MELNKRTQSAVFNIGMEEKEVLVSRGKENQSLGSLEMNRPKLWCLFRGAASLRRTFHVLLDRIAPSHRQRLHNLSPQGTKYLTQPTYLPTYSERVS